MALNAEGNPTKSSDYVTSQKNFSVKYLLLVTYI